MSNQSSSVHFDPKGTITPPRVIGRLARLLLGTYLSFHAWQVITVADVRDVDNPMMWVSVILALWLIPPIINIGLGVDTKNHVRYSLIALGVVVAVIGWLRLGSPLSDYTWWWMKVTTGYTWSHLGVSFVLSAILATPGCEMRSIPDLIARLRGISAQEHHCPGFIRQIDEWEARAFNRPGQFGPGGGDEGDS